jgi:hypothetical protein
MVDETERHSAREVVGMLSRVVLRDTDQAGRGTRRESAENVKSSAPANAMARRMISARRNIENGLWLAAPPQKNGTPARITLDRGDFKRYFGRGGGIQRAASFGGLTGIDNHTVAPAWCSETSRVTEP